MTQTVRRFVSDLFHSRISVRHEEAYRIFVAIHENCRDFARIVVNRDLTRGYVTSRKSKICFVTTSIFFLALPLLGLSRRKDRRVS
jgi:hypothetical protein